MKQLRQMSYSFIMSLLAQPVRLTNFFAATFLVASMMFLTLAMLGTVSFIPGLSCGLLGLGFFSLSEVLVDEEHKHDHTYQYGT